MIFAPHLNQEFHVVTVSLLDTGPETVSQMVNGLSCWLVSEVSGELCFFGILVHSDCDEVKIMLEWPSRVADIFYEGSGLDWLFWVSFRTWMSSPVLLFEFLISNETSKRHRQLLQLDSTTVRCGFLDTSFPLNGTANSRSVSCYRLQRPWNWSVGWPSLGERFQLIYCFDKYSRLNKK